MDIRKYLENNRLIADGAMGTYYDRLTDYKGLVSEDANITDPEMIKRIHLDYLQAGAQLIRTNTFAINSMYMDNAEDIKKGIEAGYRIAQEAVLESERDNIWIAADMGPIYESEDRNSEMIMAEYRMISDVFIALGAKVFVFETLSDFENVAETAEYIKSFCPDAFILTQFSLDRYGLTKTGVSAGKLMAQAAELEVIDGIGFNCGVGPLHLYEILKKQPFPKGKIITALPNAGYPAQLRGRTHYSENVPYYVEISSKIAQLGIDIIGGCCGTTPEHIRGISDLLRDNIRPHKKLMPVSMYKKKDSSEEKMTSFVWKLKNNEIVFAVELDPPFDQNAEKLIQGAEKLKESQIDLITVADSPLARPRAEASACAIKIQNLTNIPVMPHLSCRDKNTIALRAQFLGMHINDIRHTLIVTGDPIARGDRDSIKGVFNFNSIKLMRYLQTMNEEVFGDSPIYYGGALNQGAGRLDAIADRMRQKIDAGASFFLTQPVYSDEEIEKIAYLRKETGGKILVGIMPLVSRKNALFIKNEMPGITVPDEILEKYAEGLSREDYENVACMISLELMEKLKSKCDGYYMMTPFNRVSLISRIIREAKETLFNE